MFRYQATAGLTSLTTQRTPWLWPALRKQGYRSENRYVVFQLLELTVGLQPSTWRIFSMAHQKRNLAEYEGLSDIELTLIEALIDATEKLDHAVDKLD